MPSLSGVTLIALNAARATPVFFSALKNEATSGIAPIS